jgi:acyl-coenzyme A thioesterase PaaI-like protein
MAGTEARVARQTPDTHRTLRVREDGYCFACGPENPIGLKLDLKLVDSRAETTFVPAREHQGFAGIIHGGMIGLVLDEAMAKVLHLRGIEALTCEITVRLRRAVTVGEALKLTAWMVRERRRLLELEAEATSQAGKTVATARAKFLRVGPCEINA